MNTLISDINAIVADVLKARSMDRRTCFTTFSPVPPDATTFVFECSDAAVAEDVRHRVAATDAPVEYVLLPNGQELPELLVATNSVADVRREPVHTAELVNQVIYGDVLVPLKDQGDWYLIRTDDGYLGWIRNWHVTPSRREAVDEFLEGAGHRVRDNVVQVLEAPERSALPVGDAVIGTRVHAEPGERRGWRRISFPEGRTGFVPSRALEPVPKRAGLSRQELVTTGMRFLGIPYLWGGTTPKGFDCSGLIQRIFRLGGAVIPRDSDMQVMVGRSKPAGQPDVLKTGDLLFFGSDIDHITHVAMYLSDGLFLHACGHVRVGSLHPNHIHFEAGLVAGWCATRDPFVRV
ncbi:MAG: SH3 domain-containing C40 family peptidase [bacterium]|nr:SH3 domain-containing C40 family peptidase [bacterium]